MPFFAENLLVWTAAYKLFLYAVLKNMFFNFRSWNPQISSHVQLLFRNLTQFTVSLSWNLAGSRNLSTCRYAAVTPTLFTAKCWRQFHPRVRSGHEYGIVRRSELNSCDGNIQSHDDKVKHLCVAFVLMNLEFNSGELWHGNSCGCPVTSRLDLWQNGGSCSSEWRKL